MQRAWSQDQLAEFSGLSARTVGLLQKERETMRYARRVKTFYEGLIVYVILALMFLGFSERAGQPVVTGVFFGVGVGLIMQELMAFEVICLDFPSWEKKPVEKRVGRQL